MMRKSTLRATTALQAVALLGMGLAATPAFAQDASNSPNTQSSATTATSVPVDNNQAPVPNTNEGNTNEEIVVTGTIFRSTTSATVSPITVVTAETMDQRGTQTVQDAIQQLSSNNGPALTNSFSANGAFAAGASAVSLRGLSTNSTLVLFDGQRAAYYPLADDGSRNFVDLNTIPDDIIDRVEVLRDGASSTYGADAIAGVVNIITKRQFKGVQARAEAGITQDGNAANQRLSVIAGVGDLRDQGINAYLSGFYFHSDQVKNSDLRSPFNSDDQTGICYNGECGPNNIVNSRDPETGELEGFLIGYDTYVRPYTATNTGIAGSRYELLNPAAGCQYGYGYNLTPSEIAPQDLNGDGDFLDAGENPNSAAPVNSPVCTVDITNRFGVVTPNITRFGGSGRVTARLGDNHEGYFMVNFQQSKVDYTGFPPTIRGQANAGILFKPFSTSAGPSAALAPGSFVLSLPVYVCPTGVGDASAINTGCNIATPGAVLNPNNPFAGSNQIARIIGRPISEPTENETRSRVYRAAAGINGTVWDFDYRFDATAMHNDLRRTQNGYVYIANLLTAIAQGTYNFVDPSANTQAQRDFLTPENISNASSDLYAAQLTLGRSLFDLPGGPLQLGFGGQIRYEAVDAPSANDDSQGATQRFFTLNAFGTTGHRVVKSVFGELDAPVHDMLDINISGRYDSYSSGQNAFSPKIGAKFTPIRQLAIRATYSKGFRIPAFGEANALPTTGYTTVALSSLPQSFLDQYTIPGNPLGACTADNAPGCPTYITSYARGLTQLASPDLEPEKSRSITLGAVFTPVRNFTFTVDYFNIKKTGAITGAPVTPALTAYYACTAAQVNGGTCPYPAGYNVIPDAPETTGQFPGALPRPAFVEAPLINANTIRAKGLDFAANGRFNLGHGVRLTSSVEASYIIELSTTTPDGATEQYAGTLGNFNLTAGSGTPRWHGSWQNTFDMGKFALTGTANLFGGYDMSAEDQTGEDTAGECGLGVSYRPCRVGDYITLDLVAQFRPTEKFTFYVNMLNALDHVPDVDATTYGAYLYNPVQGGTGILGRAFRAGVKVNF